MPLRLILVVPFVFQITLAVGLTGWLSFRNGEEDISNLVVQLQQEISNKIAHHLEDKLVIPIKINQLNSDAIAIGTLSLADFNALGRTFYQQMKIFDVGYINFANPQGEFIGAERLGSGEILMNETRYPSLSTMSVFRLNGYGNRVDLEGIVGNQPPVVEEAWYADAVAAQKPIWSRIYQWDDKPEVLSISYSYPIYDAQSHLVGVIGADLLLSDLNDFLVSLKSSGAIFIVERNGLLVASSDPKPKLLPNENNAERLAAIHSSNPLISETTNYLHDKLGGLDQIKTSTQLIFSIAGQEEFLQVTPWSDAYGLDWLIISVVPKSSFMEEVYASTKTTILLCLLALVSAILFGLMTSRWISQHIQYLVKNTQEIANGNLDQTIEIQAIEELDDLAQSFNQMTAQLKTSFSELEKRVAERTAKLLEAKNAAEVANRAKSEFLESMSHELRTPLNAILGVTQLAQRNASLDPEVKEQLKVADRNGNYLLSLINDLLEIAKIGKHQIGLAGNKLDYGLRLNSVDLSPFYETSVNWNLRAYLAQMPPEWIEQLNDAAVKGFDQDIFKLADGIPSDIAPLAVHLRAWAADFQFEIIIDLIQTYRENGSDLT
ncbi:PDC sensor domain-containing protein [Nodosilinea nodulosa]|uniref:PDC sensor domain-containing protein n=1 Tax=Nodosilinea nodulosa TaxID=416001 RepID=UPI0003031BB1|nr:histidine kinase dimerization/phospho-acceptor domain-containing protein [Nodosilinea nodulosa]